MSTITFKTSNRSIKPAIYILNFIRGRKKERGLERKSERVTESTSCLKRRAIFGNNRVSDKGKCLGGRFQLTCRFCHQFPYAYEICFCARVCFLSLPGDCVRPAA